MEFYKPGDSLIRSNGNAVPVQEVMRQVHKELVELLRQREDVIRRIGTVKKTVIGLASMFGEDVLSSELRDLLDLRKSDRKPGFTKVCRSILMEAHCPLCAQEVCDRIFMRAPEVAERHKDPIASVTTVLNRLVKYGEAERVLLPHDKRAFKWVVASEAQPFHFVDVKKSPD